MSLEKKQIFSRKFMKFRNFLSLLKINEMEGIGIRADESRCSRQNYRNSKGKASFQIITLKKNSILKNIAKSKNLRVSTWNLKSVFEGLRPSNTFFNHQAKFLKFLDSTIFVQIEFLQSENLERCLSLWISVILPETAWFVGAFPNSFHFIYFQQTLKIPEFHEFATQNLLFFSSDLKTVNICQIEVNQNVEMERNTSRLRFRE